MIELIILFCFIALSLIERVRLRARAQADFNEVLGESKASMFSEAIGNLVATAGGIYLSLILLATFLGLELPTTVNLFNLKFEPVAGTSVMLALVQPFMQKAFNKLFGK